MADVEQPNVGPVLLSFPAVLRNATLSDRFAHLHLSLQDSSSPPPRQRRSKQDWPAPQGKRWVRRRENARFTHNPHVVLPSSLDFTHPLQVPLSTFPHPFSTHLLRTLPVPSSRPPPSLPSTSSAGLFSLSLRGVRRTLRTRSSFAYLVKAVETHLATWLQGGTYLNPDQARGLLHFPGDPVCGREDIREVGREAARLVWAVRPDSASGYPNSRDGAFERFIIHCVARWYGVVSFSKETDGHRLTYLLRPNITRPDPRTNAASQTLDTPPMTDASDFHTSDASFSDFNTTDASDADSVSDDLPSGTLALSDVEESRSCSPASWSALGGSDFAIDSKDDMDDCGFATSMESLSLSSRIEFDTIATPSASTASRLRNARTTTRARIPDDAQLDQQDEDPVFSRAHPDRGSRSASSPSPVRRPPYRLPTSRKSGARRRRKTRNDKRDFAGAARTHEGSFYDYVFA